MDLTKYEMLLDNADKEHVTVEETDLFSGTRIKGLYCDNHIAINKDIETEAEKACILAEELGHHYTAVGDITNQKSLSNRKQELHGRIIAYDKMVGLTGLVDAYKHHCQSASDVAEYLGVSCGFLNDAMEFYKSKYGCHTEIDNYIIFFEPCIAVMELI